MRFGNQKKNTNITYTSLIPEFFCCFFKVSAMHAAAEFFSFLMLFSVFKVVLQSQPSKKALQHMCHVIFISFSSPRVSPHVNMVQIFTNIALLVQQIHFEILLLSSYKLESRFKIDQQKLFSLAHACKFTCIPFFTEWHNSNNGLGMD